MTFADPQRPTLAEARLIISRPDLHGAVARFNACCTLEFGTWGDRQRAVKVKRAIEADRLRRIRGYERGANWLACAAVAGALMTLTFYAVTLPGNVRADLAAHPATTHYSEGSK